MIFIILVSWLRVNSLGISWFDPDRESARTLNLPGMWPAQKKDAIFIRSDDYMFRWSCQGIDRVPPLIFRYAITIELPDAINNRRPLNSVCHCMNSWKLLPSWTWWWTGISGEEPRLLTLTGNCIELPSLPLTHLLKELSLQWAVHYHFPSNDMMWIWPPQ